MRIALFGMFGIGNIGNDASLEAALHYLREGLPSADVLCICPEPELVMSQHGVRAVPTAPPAASGGLRSGYGSRVGAVVGRFRRHLRLREIHNWSYALRVLRDSDLLAIPGTGILDDFGTTPRGMPYDLFRWCVSARVRRSKVRFLSIGAGPIHNPASRLLMKAAAGLADYRTFRDAGSRSYMASIGCNTHHDGVVPDLVFSLPIPDATDSWAGRAERPLVGVNVMAYRGWAHDEGRGEGIYRRYIEKLASFVAWLLDRGYEIRLLIGEDRDLAACNDLREATLTVEPERGRTLEIASQVGTMTDLLKAMQATDLVVATRYHNLVAALMLARPVVSLGYAPKNADLMAQVGMAAYCQSIDDFDIELLKSQFEELWSRRQLVARQVERAVGKFRRPLADQFNDVFASAAASVDRQNGLDARPH